jgi:hypothetical protein
MHTLKAAAHLVGIHPRTLRRWIKAGRCEASKVSGKHGEAWAFDRGQLDALRTAAARDVESVIPDIEPVHQAPDDTPGSELSTFDGGALLAQLGTLLDSQRAAAIEAERRALGGELAGLQAQVEALQAHVRTLEHQVAVERRRGDAAERKAGAALVTIAELRDSMRQARTDRVWRAVQQVALPAPAPARTTMPFTSGQLRALRSVI